MHYTQIMTAHTSGNLRHDSKYGSADKWLWFDMLVICLKITQSIMTDWPFFMVSF
jgi:hypothetical protein